MWAPLTTYPPTGKPVDGSMPCAGRPGNGAGCLPFNPENVADVKLTNTYVSGNTVHGFVG
jgi:hypothetical protein